MSLFVSELNKFFCIGKLEIQNIYYTIWFMQACNNKIMEKMAQSSSFEYLGETTVRDTPATHGWREAPGPASG